MNASAKRMLSILSAIILMLSSVFIYTYLIKPLYGEIAELKNKNETLSQNFENYNFLNEEFQKKFDEYQNLGESIEKLSLVFPSKINESYVLRQISGIIKKNNLETQSINLKQLALKPGNKLIKGMGTLRIEAKLDGTYGNFKQFLKDIETNIMISDIIGLRIEKQSGANLSYAITVDTYYQSE